MGQYEDVIKAAVQGSLDIIEQDREKEIISRRFGLTGERETLEQIGDFLSITRERVRQLEKAIIVRLRIAAEDGKIPELAAAEKVLIRNLTEEGRIAKISVLTSKIYGHEASSLEKSYLIFLGEISASLTLIEETEKYYGAIGISDYGDEKTIKKQIDEIVTLIKTKKTPLSLEELDSQLNYEHPNYIRAIASISKQLSSLDDQWGLTK